MLTQIFRRFQRRRVFAQIDHVTASVRPLAGAGRRGGRAVRQASRRDAVGGASTTIGPNPTLRVRLRSVGAGTIVGHRVRGIGRARAALFLRVRRMTPCRRCSTSFARQVAARQTSGSARLVPHSHTRRDVLRVPQSESEQVARWGLCRLNPVCPTMRIWQGQTTDPRRWPRRPPP